MRTVVRKAVVQTKRASPITLVAVASGILGLFIGSAIVISNVSQTVKSSSDANLKVANEAIAKISTPTPRPISVATPAETPAETPVETENSDNERQIVERRQSETTNSLANARRSLANAAANVANTSIENTPASDRVAPPNAIAFCADRTLAFAVHSSVCANRGGVIKWYVWGIDDGKKPRAICNDGHISYWRYDRWATCGTGGGVRYWYY